MVGFIFGGDTGETLESLKRKRSVAEALLARSSRAPQNVGEGLSAIGNAILYRSMLGDVEKGEARGEASAANDRAAFYTGFADPALTPTAGAEATNLPSSGVADEIKATDPSIDVAGNDIYSPFIDTVKAGGLSNPYGLAAVAATGKAESGWSPKKANASWADPSESGQAGTSGGILSWRAERLQNLYNYASAKGEKPGAISPQTQAEFFLKEDPQLVAKLNSAKSPEEAADLMANAWKFAGYDRPGGEAARRRSYVNAYLPKFQGGNEVASLDPSAGMAPAAAAIEAQAPGSGAVTPVPASNAYVDPRVAAPNYDPNAPLPQASLPRQEAGAALPPVPAGRNVGPSPVVAALAGDPSAPRPISPVAAALAAPAGAGALPVSEMGSTTGRAVVAPGGRNTAVAQALAGKDYFPAAPNAPGQSGPSIQQAIQLLNNPYASQTDRALAADVVERAQKSRDPAYQLELETKRAQLDALKSKPTKQWQRLDDNTLYNPETGETKELPVSAKPTNDQQNYEYYRKFETENGRQPLGPLEWEQAQRKAGASSTSVTVGEGDKFYENLDKKNAETFAAMADAGIQARTKLGQIDRLEGLFANVPQGAVGGLKKIAGDWGIAVGDGVSDIQAASALLEKMVPEQRAPGSGPMSDADIKMFRGSLPRVLNQPGGNQLIFGALRGIAQYEQQMGEIADAVADRTITPAEGRKRIREMKNPLADFKIPEGSTPNEGFKTKTGVQWSVE